MFGGTKDTMLLGGTMIIDGVWSVICNGENSLMRLPIDYAPHLRKKHHIFYNKQRV